MFAFIKGLLSLGTIFNYFRIFVKLIPKIRKVVEESKDVIREFRKTIQIAKKDYEDGKFDNKDIARLFENFDNFLKELEDLIRIFT